MAQKCQRQRAWALLCSALHLCSNRSGSQRLCGLHPYLLSSPTCSFILGSPPTFFHPSRTMFCVSAVRKDIESGTQPATADASNVDDGRYCVLDQPPRPKVQSQCKATPPTCPYLQHLPLRGSDDGWRSSPQIKGNLSGAALEGIEGAWKLFSSHRKPPSKPPRHSWSAVSLAIEDDSLQ